jgi:RNA-directed DNA polymerase
MSDVFNKLKYKTSRQWVIEGDIKGCFDNINHNYITDTLKSWHVTDGINQSIGQMLKSKISYDGNITDSEMGTPQGGVISPLLANVALTALDEYCQQFGRKSVNKDGRYAIVSPIVRYADDFVIVCENKPEAEIIKAKVAQHLKEKVGLDLSDEKTHITHISKGFNFLGFNFRKYRSRNESKKENQALDMDNEKVLLIKPQAEKVNNLRYKLKNILKVVSPQEVGRKLNSVITGWGMYYRHVVSKVTFANLDHDIWHKLYRWSKRKHNGKPTGQIVEKYFSISGKHKWDFRDKAGKPVSKLSTIPIKRFIKINNDHRVYDVKSKEYWEMREYQNAKGSILGSGVLSALFGKQKGKCAYCKQPITNDEINSVKLHKHHMSAL